MKKLLLFLITTASLAADGANNNALQMLQPSNESIQIAVHNRPLAKIQGKTISVMDVKKKMDRELKERSPDVYENPSLRIQYYTRYWKNTLQDMIHNALLVIEAEALKLQITDGDIHKEMKEVYGPNPLPKITELGLTLDEAEEITKESIVVQSMGWYKIWSIAYNKATPELIKSSYLAYLGSLPNKDTWTYQTLSIRGSNEKECQDVASTVHGYIVENKEINFSTVLERFKPTLPNGISLSLSKDLSLSSHELSKEHLNILKRLPIDSISEPIQQLTKASNSHVLRFFQLKSFQRGDIPTFTSMEEELKNRLINNQASIISNEYFSKLKRKYCCEELDVDKMFEPNFQPFTVL